LTGTTKVLNLSILMIGGSTGPCLDAKALALTYAASIFEPLFLNLFLNNIPFEVIPLTLFTTQLFLSYTFISAFLFFSDKLSPIFFCTASTDFSPFLKLLALHSPQSFFLQFDIPPLFR